MFEMLGSGSGEFSGRARNTSEFGKPTALAELSQLKTSLFNQTSQPITGIFGSSAVAPVFGANCQTPTAHPKFEGFNSDGTSSLFGTPTETATPKGGLVGQQNASMGKKTGGGCFDSSNSKTSFQQSKPAETPLAQPTSNIFAAPQTSTAVNGIFSTSTNGQTKTSIFNQTSQSNMGIFGSTAVVPVFGASCQTPTAHLKFEGFNADGTSSLFGTPTETATPKGGLVGQQNASMGKKTGGGCFDSSNSKTSFQQSKPAETPLAQPTSNIFAAPQTSTAVNGIFSTSTNVLGQTKTSIFNQTSQSNMGIFGSTAVVPVFGANCQTPTAHPKFEGFNTDGTSSLFGTPTETSTPKGGLIGQQNASMGKKTGGGCFDSSNSKTSFQQSKPAETPLAQPTSNIFAAPQTSTAVNGIFSTSTNGQTKTSIFNQTSQSNMGIFGSTAVVPVFGANCQTPTAHPKFEGFNSDGTSSLFGTPTETATPKGGLVGQQNASMGKKTGGGCFDSSNSKTSFQQSKPAETPLAQPTSNIFAAPQTSTAVNGIFSTSTNVLGQTKTSIFNQTSQSNMGIFGSTAVVPVFGANCQTPTAHPKFEGFNTDGTSSLFGTPTETSTPKGGLLGQQNASMGKKTGGGCFDSSNSKTSFQQSKPAETPLAQPTSNIFAAPQTSTAVNGIFSTSTNVLGQTKKARNTSEFGMPTALAELSQLKTSLFNQTSQRITGIFGSPAVAPVFGISCQTPTAHSKFEGFNADGTCSLFGTPTATSTSNGELFGQQNASMGGKTGVVCLGSSNSFRQSKPSGTPLAQPTSNIFAAPQTNTAGTGIFGSSTTGYATSGFGATSAGCTAIKFNPVTDTDTRVINGVVHKINTSHQSITVMKEYETKAFEELRFEYYLANSKVEQQGAVYGGIFESPKTLFSSTTTLNTGSFRVNDNNSLYSATSTTPILLGDFYIDVMTKIQLFAAPQTNIFGTTPPSTFVTQTTGFGQTGFGQPNQNNLFGQNKPAFGLGSTQTTAFGTDNTFGATSTAQPATRGLFSSKAFTEAPTTSLFNQTTNNLTGVFNATNSGGKWKKNTRNEGTGLFGPSHPSSVGTGRSFSVVTNKLAN